MQVRHAVGTRPCRWSSRPTARDVKAAAAAEVLQRYGGDVADDPLADLWSSDRLNQSTTNRQEKCI